MMAHNLVARVGGQIIKMFSLTEQDIDVIKKKPSLIYQAPSSLDEMKENQFYVVPSEVDPEAMNKVTVSATPLTEDEVDNKEIAFFEINKPII